MPQANLFISASIVGRDLLTNLEFDPQRDHTFCRICGAVFQSELDRIDQQTVFEAFEARMRRMEWSHRHAKRHPSREHEELARSGRFLTPEATEKLVPYGIIPVQDIVMSDEVRHAGLLAPRAPINDAEC